MANSENIVLVQRLLEATGRGDNNTVVNACAEDITIFIPGPDVIPFAGHFKGREAVREYFDMIPRTFDILSFAINDVIAQGSKVVVNGHEVGVAKSTGKRFDNHWVMVWTIHDGIVTDIFEYHDTAAIAEAFTP